MDVGIPAKGGLGKPIFDKQIIQHAPVKIAGLKVDQLPICFTGINRAVLPGKLADQPAVV